MKIIVLHPQACALSAASLAKELGAASENPWKKDRKDYREYDLVINYGCNRNIKATRLINSAKAVACCIDKLRTFTVLQEAGIKNIPEFTTNAAKTKDWELVVVRKEVDGKGNAGMQYINPEKQAIPDAPLYTKYFYHKTEYRVVVVPEKNGIMSVEAYEKKNVDGEWEFLPDNSIHLDAMKAECIKAANALKIDHVGFDVLMDRQKKFVILEANSGPILLEDTVKAFKKMLKNVV